MLINCNLLLQENKTFSFRNPDMDDRFEKVDEYLFLNLGFSSKQNAWAGPDHWKYQKAKGPVEGDTVNWCFCFGNSLKGT